MGSEAKFTSGPWHVVPGDSVVNIIDGGPNAIAATNSKPYWKKYDAEDMANAHLIASAPDLYEALKAFVEAGDGHDDFENQWPAAIAALARAEGQG